MTDADRLNAALAPVLEVVQRIDPADPEARARLEEALPLDGPALTALRAVVREGVEARWLAERENAGVRFGRVRKASSDDALSIDCGHRDAPGPGHTHPNGEIDLCFAVSGEPTSPAMPRTSPPASTDSSKTLPSSTECGSR